MALSPFHLAIPVSDLAVARHFYRTVFNLREGRSSDEWVDFDFYGRQLVIHANPQTDTQNRVRKKPPA
ncbi:glyoxalase superfamily protein [Erwinia tracheiphila PSU-1]|nr:glyoxalase superfamily protein [Erwinia tracheiphila PSU-1]